MKALARALPLAVFTLGFGATAVAEESLPPIFVPIAERAKPAKLELAPLVRPTLISDRTRALLDVQVASLPAQPPGERAALLRTPAGEIVTMEKYIVNMPRLPQWRVRREEPPLLRILKSGVFYRHVTPGGQEVEGFISVLPLVSGGALPREFTRFAIGVRIRW